MTPGDRDYVQLRTCTHVANYPGDIEKGWCSVCGKPIDRTLFDNRD